MTRNFHLFRDSRDYQIAFLLAFLILGIRTRDWTVRLDWIFVGIASCLASQWLANRLRQTHNPSFRSAWITALSLCLLLRGNSLITMILASVASITSKLVFRWRGKHFFNPSNFGIIAALLCTKDAWVSPGQWGEDWWYLLLFAGAGGIVLQRVGRWDTSGAFFGFYAFLEAVRNVYLGWTWDVYLHRLMSGSLILFSLFMITDPRTIPNERAGRILWSMCVAFLAYILRNYFFMTSAIFWALFFLSPFAILFDSVWKDKRFSWENNPEKMRTVPDKDNASKGTIPIFCEN